MDAAAASAVRSHHGTYRVTADCHDARTRRTRDATCTDVRHPATIGGASEVGGDDEAVDRPSAGTAAGDGRGRAPGDAQAPARPRPARAVAAAGLAVAALEGRCGR